MSNQSPKSDGRPYLSLGDYVPQFEIIAEEDVPVESAEVLVPGKVDETESEPVEEQSQDPTQTSGPVAAAILSPG